MQACTYMFRAFIVKYYYLKRITCTHRKKRPKLCFLVDGKMIGFLVSLKHIVTVTASGSGLFAAGPAGLGFKFVFLHGHIRITCCPVRSIPLRNFMYTVLMTSLTSVHSGRQ